MKSKSNLIVTLLVVIFLTSACSSTQIASTSTIPATVIPLPVFPTSIVPTAVPTPGGEVIYAIAGKPWEWWSYRDGLAKPISWMNPASGHDRTIVWFKIMKNLNYVAAISLEMAGDWNYSLVIFNRNDYTTPVSVTFLDPSTQSLPWYMDNAGMSIVGPDIIPLFDYTTSPATINLWSFDTTGVLTKVKVLGPERRSGDQIDCAKNATRSDVVYLSPDGSKVFWRWEYTIGGNCVQPADYNMGQEFIEFPTAIMRPWEVLDMSGRVLVSGESTYDPSMRFGSDMWPRGWAGNDMVLFESFESSAYLPDSPVDVQCIYVANITTHSTTCLYCDNNAPPGFSHIKISPDGKYVAFDQGYHDLVIVDIATGEVTYSSATGPIDLGYLFDSILVWSPDSQWVGWTMIKDAGSFVNENFINAIFITQREGKGNTTLNNPKNDYETIPYYWIP